MKAHVIGVNDPQSHITFKMLNYDRSIKHPADSDKQASDKVAASEGNDDFDLEKFILEETRRRRRQAEEEDVKGPDAQPVSQFSYQPISGIGPKWIKQFLAIYLIDVFTF